MRKTFDTKRSTVLRRFGVGVGIAALTLVAAAVPSTAQAATSGGKVSRAVHPNTSSFVGVTRVPPNGQFIPPHVGEGDTESNGHGPNVAGREITPPDRAADGPRARQFPAAATHAPARCRTHQRGPNAPGGRSVVRLPAARPRGRRSSAVPTFAPAAGTGRPAAREHR